MELVLTPMVGDTTIKSKQVTRSQVAGPTTTNFQPFISPNKLQVKDKGVVRANLGG